MNGLRLEETELRLGLPGDGDAVKNSCKRGFEETIDLKLKLPTIGMEEVKKEEEATINRSPSVKNLASASVVATSDPEKPRAPKYIILPLTVCSYISILILSFTWPQLLVLILLHVSYL